MNWIKSKAINKAYVAQLLYGKNTSVTRSKLNQKIRGEKNFTESELEKLKEIKQLIGKQFLE